MVSVPLRPGKASIRITLTPLICHSLTLGPFTLGEAESKDARAQVHLTPFTKSTTGLKP